MNLPHPESLPKSRRAGVSRTLFLISLLTLFGAGLFVGAQWSARRNGAHTAEEHAGQGQLWTCGMHPQVIQDEPGNCPICGMTLTPVKTPGTADSGASGERKIRYWWDPMMNPPYISDQPGQSPMGMDLVPVYEDEVAAGEALVIDPAVVQNMGLRLTAVTTAPLARTIRAVGVVSEPEPARHDVNLRVGGWIDRLHADTEGVWLTKGDPLFELYSPELQVAVEELIGARKMSESPAARAQAEVIFRSAARKLELYGLESGQVSELARLDQAPRTVTFLSPADGYLVMKSVFAGSAVAAGDMVMRIADTSSMWMDTRVFEKDLARVQVGQEVAAQVDGRPGETFSGQVILVHPRIDATTRTALVRMEINNAELTLREGMFATAFLKVEIAERAVIVPREAIIDTGSRQIAFVALDLSHFEPRLVLMGASGDDGMVEVLSGLAPGEQVVVSGQFLLDAESRMKEAIRRFLEQKQHPAAEVVANASAEWMSATEDALAAYLTLADALGMPEAAADPLDMGRLIGAAHALRDRAAEELQTKLSDQLLAAAEDLQGLALARQREGFATVSEAAIGLATGSPRTGVRVPDLFIAYCPMKKMRWMQSTESIMNPYYAQEMKECGDVVSIVPVSGHEESPR